MESTETSVVMFMSDISDWRSRVDPSKIDEDSRYRILRYAVSKFGHKRVREVIGVSRVTLWRLIGRKSPVKPEYVKPLLELLSLDEFERIVEGRRKLVALGIVRDDGSIDYSLVLEILAIARSDEYLKNAILRFVVQEFREDLKKMLGLSFAGIKFNWTEDFEHFLTHRKKRRRVRDPETVQYYRNLFKRFLEGRELSEELVEYVVSHENKWLRNVFRHYIQYLYFKRRISPEIFGWIMEVVPSRSYKLDVRPYPISIEDVRHTLNFLSENHRAYYMIYRVMIESGARYEHVLKLIERWSPSEVIEIPRAEIVTRRLVRLDNEGFCRYYMGLRGPEKPCEWIYFTTKTLELLESIAPRHINRRQVTRYAKRNNLVLPKYMRKIAWRLMIRSMNREVARFIQSRLGELKVSEARYEDLLNEADNQYPSYIKLLEHEKLIVQL